MNPELLLSRRKRTHSVPATYGREEYCVEEPGVAAARVRCGPWPMRELFYTVPNKKARGAPTSCSSILTLHSLFL